MTKPIYNESGNISERLAALGITHRKSRFLYKHDLFDASGKFIACLNAGEAERELPRLRAEYAGEA